MQYLFGFHPVMEAVRAGKVFDKVLLRQGMDGPQYRELMPLLKSAGIPVQFVPVEKLNRRRRSAIVVTTADGPRRVLLERIRYAERVGRCVRYYCTDSTVDSQTIRVSFREAAAPLLADRRFCLCGASFVINFQHVTGVNGQTALLDSGQTVALPRTAAADFKKAWGNYWLEEETAW